MGKLVVKESSFKALFQRPKSVIAVCSVIFIVQILVIGAPKYQVSRIVFDSSATGSRVLEIPRRFADPLDSDNEHYARYMEAAVSYASVTGINVPIKRDGVAIVTNNVNEQGIIRPAQLIAAHGPNGTAAPNYRRVSFPVLDVDSIPYETFLFGSPSAMAVGDFRPATGLGEDLVVGFNQGNSSTLALVHDFDARLFSGSSISEIPASNLITVPFNCAANDPTSCISSQVDALATGDFNDDSWLDIAIVASNTNPYYSSLGLGTYLFLCNQVPPPAQNPQAPISFECAPRQLLADGATTGSYDGEGCDPKDPKCVGRIRYPFGQSFPIVRSTEHEGYFIAAYTEGSWVRIAEFEGASPQPGAPFPAQYASVIERDYQQDYPAYAPVAALAVDIVNLTGGANSLPDLVVQIQPDYRLYDFDSYPWSIISSRVYPQLVVSQNQIGWSNWPANKRVLPIGSTSQAWDTVPMLVGEFASVPDSAGIDGKEAVVPGLVAPIAPVSEGDRVRQFTSTNSTVGAELSPLWFQTQIAGGEIPIRSGVAGEFLRSSYSGDNGVTPMRADLAVITDPDSIGTRRIFFRANLLPQSMRVETLVSQFIKVLSDGNFDTCDRC